MSTHLPLFTFTFAAIIAAAPVVASPTSEPATNPTTEPSTTLPPVHGGSKNPAAVAANQEGLATAQRGDYENAITLYRNAIKIDPKFVIAYINMANSLYQTKQYAAAKETLKTAIALDPSNYVIWMNVGVMASSVGDLESGERYFRIAGYYSPQSNEVWKDLGKVLMRTTSLPNHPIRPYEAIGYFKRAIDLNANDTDAAINLAAAEATAVSPPNPEPTPESPPPQTHWTGGKFSIHGDVADGQVFELGTHKVSLLGAIAEAGWLQLRVRDALITVTRNEGGSRFVAIDKVAISDIQSRQTPDYAVHPDDEIVVVASTIVPASQPISRP